MSLPALAADPPAEAVRPELSIVVPMYNEEEMVPILVERLTAAIEALGVTFEILCVDDGSRDGTAAALAEAHARDPRVHVIRLSRNFGKEIALTAGLDHVSGMAVVPMDADLQDPPELLGPMLAHWREGYEVVRAVRRQRDADSWFKRSSARAFYGVISRLAGIEIAPDAGDFRLMDRRVVAAISEMRERTRFMKGLFAWVGFNTIDVEYDRPQRVAGKTKFGFWKLWNLALDGITGFSTLPLRAAGYLGALVAACSFLFASFLALRALVIGVDVPGYTSLMVSLLFISGVQLVVLGTMGEYLGRIYGETRRRPLYLVKSSLGITRPPHHTAPE